MCVYAERLVLYKFGIYYSCFSCWYFTVCISYCCCCWLRFCCCCSASNDLNSFQFASYENFVFPLWFSFVCVVTIHFGLFVIFYFIFSNVVNFVVVAVIAHCGSVVIVYAAVGLSIYLYILLWLLLYSAVSCHMLINTVAISVDNFIVENFAKATTWNHKYLCMCTNEMCLKSVCVFVCVCACVRQCALMPQQFKWN